MLKEFTYVKDESDEVSERIIFVLAKPSKNYFGLDVSKLSKEDAKYVDKCLTELKNRQKEEFNNLIEQFNLGKSFRSFKESCVVEES